MVNGILQGAGQLNDYQLSEVSGITSITFTGTAQGGTNITGNATTTAVFHKILPLHWHLLTITNSGTSGTDHFKIYIDGVEAVTSSTDAANPTDINLM